MLATAITSLLGLSLIAGLVAWWIPPRSEVEALRAERDQLAASVVDLEKRGGRAKLTLCGGQPCIRTDDTKGVYGEPAKGETYRVIKGY